MSDEFPSIKAGLEQAIAFVKGEPVAARVHFVGSGIPDFVAESKAIYGDAVIAGSYDLLEEMREDPR